MVLCAGCVCVPPYAKHTQLATNYLKLFAPTRDPYLCELKTPLGDRNVVSQVFIVPSDVDEVQACIRLRDMDLLRYQISS